MIKVLYALMSIVVHILAHTTFRIVTPYPRTTQLEAKVSAYGYDIWLSISYILNHQHH
jgi:hypothetical protein